MTRKVVPFVLVALLLISGIAAAAPVPIPIPAPVIPPVMVPGPISTPGPQPDINPGKTKQPEKNTQSPPELTPDDIRNEIHNSVKQEMRGNIDDWATDQVDKPLKASREFLPRMGLSQPPLLLPSQQWAFKGWSLGLLIGILLVLFALLNHARHAMKGTDLLRGRNPLVRFAVPLAALVAMIAVPWMWETLRVTQEWLWASDGFNRHEPDSVLGVILPAPEPESTQVPTATTDDQASPTPAQPPQPPKRPESTYNVQPCDKVFGIGGSLPNLEQVCYKETRTNIQYPLCPIFPGNILIHPAVPCIAARSGWNLDPVYTYPQCAWADKGSPCTTSWPAKEKFRYPTCGQEIPGQPCHLDGEDPSTPYTPPPESDTTPTPPTTPESNQPTPPTAPTTSQVGSIKPVSAKLGTATGVGTGLAVLVLGILSFLGYLIGRLLIITAPVYLGIAAFSDRIEPALGWLDLAFRTNTLITLFNLAWLLMRNLPTWMAWTLVDALIFVLLVLPLLLIAIYLWWCKRLWAVLMDPLMLGGGKVLDAVGTRAGGIGRALAVAGGMLGAPALVTAGSTLSSWGNRTTRTGDRLTANAGQGPEAVLGNMPAPQPAASPTQPDNSTTPAPPHKPQTSTRGPSPRTTHNAPTNPAGDTDNPGGLPKSERSQTTARPTTVGSGAPQTVNTADSAPCWTDGGQFVTLSHGVPTWHPTQPPGTHIVGAWQPQE